MFNSVTILFILALSHSSLAQQTKVIYGADNRKDLYEVDTMTARLADATAVHALPHELTIHGDTARLNTTMFGTGFALCPSEPFYNQPTVGHCSAFLVAPDVLVTAGHCMSTASTCEQARYVFGFGMKSANAPTNWDIPISEIYRCAKIIHSVAGDLEDFAVVQLDRTVVNHSPLAYRTVGAPQKGDPLMSIGYPEGLPVKIAGGAHVRSVNKIYLQANLDTYGGNSGSAIFNANTGIVEGILVRGDNDFDLQNGCYVSHRCPDDGCRGEDATLISRVLPYLEQ